MILKEEINYNVTKMNRNGQEVKILYIDPEKSEKVADLASELKKYKCNWDSNRKWFYWALPNDDAKQQKLFDNYINPCIEFLNSVEDEGKTTRTPDFMKTQVMDLIKKIDEIVNTPTAPEMDNFAGLSKDEFDNKLLQFKKELLAATTDEEFRRLFAPVMKMVSGTNGYKYSPMNSFLILMQDPQATMVLSKSKWLKLNRYVYDLKKGIWLWIPVTVNGNADEITKRFLNDNGVNSVDELTPEQKEELDEMIKSSGSIYFKLVCNFYDIRFTKVKRGKKDGVIGGGEHLVNTKTGNEDGNLKWFDGDTPVTEETINIYNAIIQMIQDSGIDLRLVDTNQWRHGEARGISKGGVIEVLKDAPKNIGTCNTLVHEFSHELFHHMNFKDKEAKPWGKYYIGRNEGRGVIEQQAELCAWIVMRYLGYDMPTSINYIGNWGLNEENAVKIFDQVALAADKIVITLRKHLSIGTMETDAEDERLDENIDSNNGLITGLDVAKLFGKAVANLYLRSEKKEEENLSQNMNELNEYFKRICGVNIK